MKNSKVELSALSARQSFWNADVGLSDISGNISSLWAGAFWDQVLIDFFFFSRLETRLRRPRDA